MMAKVYLFEATFSGHIIDVYEIDPQEIEEYAWQIEREGNTSFSCSKDYVKTILKKAMQKFQKLDSVYEDALKQYLGSRDWDILKYTEEVCYVATLNGRRLYAF